MNSFTAGESSNGIQLNLLQSVTPSQSLKPLELRPYQQQMKRDIYAHIRAGTRRILVYGPTGSGKTLVLSSVIQDALSRDKRCLLLVHRDFLVEQTIATLLSLGVAGENIGVIKAKYRENRDRPLQIAGIQSLNNREIPAGIDLVVSDECHTMAFWGGYQRVRSFTPNSIHLGFTASPWRLKPHVEYFGIHYDAIVRGPSIKALMNDGHLSRVRYFGWGGVADLSKLETNSEGDFKETQMEALFMESDVPTLIVEKVQALCDGRTGIVFNAGCEQSRLQTRLLNEAGIPCAHIDAKTSTDERREIYRQLEAGEIRCISSIGCLTEGFDVKSISFIVLARATKSRALYVQICGRGIRSCPGKEDCLILDFGGNVSRLGHLTKNWEITLAPKPKKEESPAYKDCPECGCVCHLFAKFCPECGFEFTGSKPTDDGLFEKEFGELFDPQTLALVKYARQQRKSRFSKNHPPDRLWELFKEKYGRDVFLIGEWLKGAVFAGNNTPANRQRFLDYLNGFKLPGKSADSWVRHHLALEFGTVDQVSPLDCWQVLGCERTATRTEIKAVYLKALRRLEGDEGDEIDLLNWALEKALSHR